MSLGGQFDMADKTYRAACRGEEDWSRVIAMYRHLERTVEAKPHLEKARLRLAEAYLSAGKPWTCIRTLERAAQLHGNRRDRALFRIAMVLMARAVDAPSDARGRTLRTRAIAAYGRVAEEHPESKRAPEALFFVGNNLFKHKYNGRGAVEAFEQLIRRYPQTREARIAAKLIPRIQSVTDKQLREQYQ